VTEIAFEQLLEVIPGAQVSYNKLVLIAGATRSGKSTLLNRVAGQLKVPVVNLSVLLSERLLSLTKRQRKLRSLEAARELIDEQDQSCVCLDNTELLFDSALGLNALQFLQDVSRNRLILATWNGGISDGILSFGYPEHPDFFEQRISATPVVLISEDKLYLHLPS
jgi:hypothetical protein